MSDPKTRRHYYRGNTEAACEHCGGVLRHEIWCIARDPLVYYAHQIVADPSKLTVGDALILHSLGVTWSAKPCAQGAAASRSSVI